MAVGSKAGKTEGGYDRELVRTLSETATVSLGFMQSYTITYFWGPYKYLFFSVQCRADWEICTRPNFNWISTELIMSPAFQYSYAGILRVTVHLNDCPGLDLWGCVLN